jgi:hypothetical protein
MWTDYFQDGDARRLTACAVQVLHGRLLERPLHELGLGGPRPSLAPADVGHCIHQAAAYPRPLRLNIS